MRIYRCYHCRHTVRHHDITPAGVEFCMGAGDWTLCDCSGYEDENVVKGDNTSREDAAAVGGDE